MFIFLKKFWKFFIGLVILLFFVFLFSRGHVYEKNELKYGVTFSQQQAQSLGLNWRDTYTAILDELVVKNLRLSAYWDEIENKPGEFYWEDLDWQIKEAGKRNVKIILAVGGRLPRWPECHWPEWAKNLNKEERNGQVLKYIKEVINKYKEEKNIVAWQIENEPFLYGFGVCPIPDIDFIDSEIALVRSLDSRPIVITDSGELSLWYPAAKRADIFGTSIYRHTYSNNLKRYIHYPIAPGFFRFKKNVVNIFAHPKKWIVIELQAEPWAPKPFQEIARLEREETMSLEKFKDTIEFARLSSFKEFYLWGAEFWYWERTVNGNPEFWNEAKGLFVK